MKKILYLMHLPWGWIKQRPHFLAEGLSAHYPVEVVYRFYRVPFEGKLVRNSHQPGLKLRPLVILPLNRFAPIAALNAALIRCYLRHFIDLFDIIWFTHPEMFEAIGSIVPDSARVVYDCMDNHCAFDLASSSTVLTSRLRRSEQALLDRCDTVIASSQTLREMLGSRYGVKKPIHVVNNGIHLEPVASMPPLLPETENSLAAAAFRLTYVGTIANWLDLDLLFAVLERFPTVSIFLFGPCEIDLPQHPRLFQMGPVLHAQVYTVMERSDVLFMPFKVTELIRGVDPVKMYEYAYSGKPAISVDYPEVRKFAEFVHLYRSKEEFLILLGKVISGEAGAKQSPEACREFAMENSWCRRAEQVTEILGLETVDA